MLVSETHRSLYLDNQTTSRRDRKTLRRVANRSILGESRGCEINERDA